MSRTRQYQSNAERQAAYRQRKQQITPYWQSADGRHCIYHADYLTVLPSLSGIDAVITDPPFNAGRSFANDHLSDAGWKTFCTNLGKAMKRLDAENVLVEVSKRDTVMRGALDAVLPFKWTITLNYTNGMRQGAVGYANTGLVLWYGGHCYQRYMDRIDCPIHSTIGEFTHETPKEVGHYARLVEMFSPEDATILDCCMGSGTTGLACIKTRRRFIGIDVDLRSVDMAIERMERELQQAVLSFDEPLQMTLS